MDVDLIMLEVEDAMTKAVDFLLHEFATVRTGKASPALVEGIDIHVQSYGSSSKLKQLAMITTPDPRTIMIQPFDPSTTGDIERGISESKLGINPAVDGKIIRLPIPELSEERRKELAKMASSMAEEARVRVRQARRDAMDGIKSAQKSKDITEDDQALYEKDVQKLTDKHVAKVDEHFSKKEKEILTV
ncbi:MAG: ribosome recycling factor [Verrucomicrobiota bacterium]